VKGLLDLGFRTIGIILPSLLFFLVFGFHYILQLQKEIQRSLDEFKNKLENHIFDSDYNELSNIRTDEQKHYITFEEYLLKFGNWFVALCAALTFLSFAELFFGLKDIYENGILYNTFLAFTIVFFIVLFFIILLIFYIGFRYKPTKACLYFSCFKQIEIKDLNKKHKKYWPFRKRYCSNLLGLSHFTRNLI